MQHPAFRSTTQYFLYRIVWLDVLGNTVAIEMAWIAVRPFLLSSPHLRLYTAELGSLRSLYQQRMCGQASPFLEVFSPSDLLAGLTIWVLLNLFQSRSDDSEKTSILLFSFLLKWIREQAHAELHWQTWGNSRVRVVANTAVRVALCKSVYN